MYVYNETVDTKLDFLPRLRIAAPVLLLNTGYKWLAYAIRDNLPRRLAHRGFDKSYSACSSAERQIAQKEKKKKFRKNRMRTQQNVDYENKLESIEWTLKQ